MKQRLVILDWKNEQSFRNVVLVTLVFPATTVPSIVRWPPDARNKGTTLKNNPNVWQLRHLL